MTDPAPRPGLTRRTTLGAAAWTAPVVVAATAAPSYAASTVTTLNRITPSTTTFESTRPSAQLAQVRLLTGTTPEAGRTVTFALSDTTWLRFAGGATSAAVVTDSSGDATTTLTTAPGANPAAGTTVTLVATHGSLQVSWTVAFRPLLLAPGVAGLHTLAVADGRAYGWGYNVYGQVGVGTATNVLSPTAVSTTAGTSSLAGRTVVAVAAGGYHSLALTSDGRVHAWGQNPHGQLGTGTTTDRSVPTLVTTSGTSLNGRSVVAIAAGRYHSLALTSDGTVHSWGLNDHGQLGTASAAASSTLPAKVGNPNLTGYDTRVIAAIGTGWNHSFAIDSAGRLFTWGAGGEGQLGRGSSSDVRFPDSPVLGPAEGRTITGVSGGEAHTLALDSTGRVYSWGRNVEGQLGTGSYTGRSTPGLVNTTEGTSSIAGATVVSIAAGWNQSCVLDSTGKAHSWGEAGRGALGQGSTTTNRPAPRPVVATGALAGKVLTELAGAWVDFYVATDDRQLFAWGGNERGNLGNGSAGGAATTPVAVDPLPA